MWREKKTQNTLTITINDLTTSVLIAFFYEYKLFSLTEKTSMVFFIIMKTKNMI